MNSTVATSIYSLETGLYLSADTDSFTTGIDAGVFSLQKAYELGVYAFVHDIDELAVDRLPKGALIGILTDALDGPTYFH